MPDLGFFKFCMIVIYFSLLIKNLCSKVHESLGKTAKFQLNMLKIMHAACIPQRGHGVLIQWPASCRSGRVILGKVLWYLTGQILSLFLS